MHNQFLIIQKFAIVGHICILLLFSCSLFLLHTFKLFSDQQMYCITDPTLAMGNYLQLSNQCFFYETADILNEKTMKLNKIKKQTINEIK